MKTFEEIENTGEWWLQEGWKSDRGLKRQRYTNEEILSAIDTLKPIFTADWFRNSLRTSVRNIVVANLIHIGPPSNDFLIDLSQIVRSLQDVEGFGPVCERLKGKESESAFFEMEMASIFHEKGIKVEFAKRGKNKTPDIIAYFPGEPIAIECKHLEKEQWEIWVGKLHSAVHSAVTRPDRKFKIQLQLDPTLSDIHFDDEKEPVINEAIYSAILTNIKDIVDKMLETSILPVDFEIPSLVTATIFPVEAQIEETTSGAYISTTAKLRRIFTNGFLRAEKQLPKEMPGIVAVYSDYLPDPTFARIVFDAITKSQPERFKHVVALIIFPLQTYFYWTPPLLFDNKYSATPFHKLQCTRVIKDSFSPQLC